MSGACGNQHALLETAQPAESSDQRKACFSRPIGAGGGIGKDDRARPGGRCEIGEGFDRRIRPDDRRRLAQIERLAGGYAGVLVNHPNRGDSASSRQRPSRRAADVSSSDDGDERHRPVILCDVV